MELLDLIENRPRGVYSGAIGYLGADGGADLSIAIRTIVNSRDAMTIGAGGAITVQSDARAELRELLLKARAPLDAVGLALHGRRDGAHVAARGTGSVAANVPAADERSRFQLAQLNIALPREPLDRPLLADFVAAIAPVNAAADASPGFVWRLPRPMATQPRSAPSATIAWSSTSRSGSRSKRCASSSTASALTSTSCAGGGSGLSAWANPPWFSGGCPPATARASRRPSGG